MRSQMGGRIARDDGIELHGIGAQDGLVVDTNTIRILQADRARNDRVVQVHVVIGTRVVAAAVRDVRAALDLGDTPRSASRW